MSDPTHRITVNFSNCDHWHWSLNGGGDTMVMSGTTTEIVAPVGGTLTVRGVNSEHIVLAEDTAQLNAPVAPGPEQLSSIGGGTNTIATNWGNTVQFYSNDRSYAGCNPNMWGASPSDVVLPAELNVPETGSIVIAQFYTPKAAGSGHPALTLAEWQEYQAFVDSGQPWTRVVSRNTVANHSLGPYASGATTFKCGAIGWTRGRYSYNSGLSTGYANLVTLITLTLTSDGTIVSSDPSLFDAASVNALYQ